MIRLTTARHAEWMTEQGIMGEVYAKHQLEKTVEMLKKYTKSAKQKKLAKVAFADSDNWHYWCNEVSDKYIAMVRYALRRVDKGQDLAVLCNIYNKHGMLKTPFLRYLEYLAAKNDHSNWIQSRLNMYRHYMPVDEALARAKNYYNLLVEEFEC